MARAATLEGALRFALRLLAVTLLGTTTDCTAVSGIGDLSTVGVGSRLLPDGGVDPGPVVGPYRRTVTLTSNAAGPLSYRPVLVVLPSSFPYEHAAADGSDVRFSATANRAGELPYFIEKWRPGGESEIWVRVPSVPVGASAVYLFYGQPEAASAESFAGVFPTARRTAGGGAGNITADGDIAVDWFELAGGDTLTLAAGAPLRITAQRIIITGTIQGTGRGHPGGTAANPIGKGPGGGGYSSGANNGAGGGGYGGSGGSGGRDSGTPGAPGAAYGSATDVAIDMGSGGGAGAGAGRPPGGGGGGAITLDGWHTTITGTVVMNGADGVGATLLNAGGGAGGGILALGWSLDLAGAVLSANGGAGGPCTRSDADGGGGGGGGRIKLATRDGGRYVAPATMTAALGIGGAGGDTTAPGEGGTAGSIHVDNASTSTRGVSTALGIEESAR